MSSRLSIRGASSTSAALDSSKAQRDEVNKIQQDINIVTQRIAELKGEPVPTLDNSDSGSASPFVVGIRALADSDKKLKDMKELKISTLEKLLEKVSEYDRLLLRETAPVVDPTQVPLRRKSFGQDLYYMPTHLHLTARLMDLHASSKRVTVIKMTEPGTGGSSSGPPPNPADKKTIDSLKSTVATQSKQLSDIEAKRIHSEEENAQLKRSNEEMKEQLAALQAKVVKLQIPAPAPAPVVDTTPAAPIVSTAAPTLAVDTAKLEAINGELRTAKAENANALAEMTALKAQLVEQTHTISALQERLEVESGVVQSIVSVILGKANRINSHIELDGKGDDCINLPADVRNAFGILERAFSGRIDGLKMELSLIMSIKELLEGELSTANLQKDMLQRDLSTVSEQHEALKTAYDSLSYEAARLQSQNSNIEAQNQSKELLERANESNARLLMEFQEAQRTILELQKWPILAKEAENRLSTAVTEKTRAETASAAAKEEVAHYKKLTETLKQKLRDLGAAGGGDSKEFLDSFEEVMKEEMMTMKAAFESKLRLAREEADATSKKHQQEIVRMNAASPYAALARSGVTASGTSGATLSNGTTSGIGFGNAKK